MSFCCGTPVCMYVCIYVSVSSVAHWRGVIWVITTGKSDSWKYDYIMLKFSPCIAGIRQGFWEVDLLFEHSLPSRKKLCWLDLFLSASMASIYEQVFRIIQHGLVPCIEMLCIHGPEHALAVGQTLPLHVLPEN